MMPAWIAAAVVALFGVGAPDAEVGLEDELRRFRLLRPPVGETPDSESSFRLRLLFEDSLTADEEDVSAAALADEALISSISR